MNKHQVILMLMIVLSLTLFPYVTLISQSQTEHFLSLTPWGDPDLKGIWDLRIFSLRFFNTTALLKLRL